MALTSTVIYNFSEEYAAESLQAVVEQATGMPAGQSLSIHGVVKNMKYVTVAV